MALVESAGREIRCRRCRHQVLEEPPHRILEQEDEDNQEAANTLSICDDNLPPWIADAIEEVSVTACMTAVTACMTLRRSVRRETKSLKRVRATILSKVSFVW